MNLREVLSDWSQPHSAIDGPCAGRDNPKYVLDILRIHLRRSIVNGAIRKPVILPMPSSSSCSLIVPDGRPRYLRDQLSVSRKHLKNFPEPWQLCPIGHESCERFSPCVESRPQLPDVFSCYQLVKLFELTSKVSIWKQVPGIFQWQIDCSHSHRAEVLRRGIIAIITICIAFENVK